MAHPEFPPLLKGYAVNHIENGKPINLSDLISKAETEAIHGTLSAGDLLWSTDQDRAECAIVLEPEISTEQALEMVPLAMVAIADSLGAISPPNLAITFSWPNIINANGARIGRVDIRFPRQAAANKIPDFAILAISLAIKWPTISLTEPHATDHKASLQQSRPEPGDNLTRTVLHEEGCGDLDSTLIIESLSRHFLSWVDSWEQEGFKIIYENWCYRAEENDKPFRIKVNKIRYEGIRIGFDEKAGLFLKGNHDIKLLSLSDYFLNQSSDTESKSSAEMQG